MKTGYHPMKVKLRLFFKWGITFGEPYVVTEKANRRVAYADKKEIEEGILEKYRPDILEAREKAKERALNVLKQKEREEDNNCIGEVQYIEGDVNLNKAVSKKTNKTGSRGFKDTGTMKGVHIQREGA